MTAGDLPAFHHASDDWSVVRMTGSYPWPVPLTFSRYKLRQYAAMQPPQGGVFGIFERRHGGRPLLGSIGFYPCPPDQNGASRAELGYHLGKSAWGRGLATEAGRAALGWADETLGRSLRITAGVYVDNPASHRVLEKLGFRPVGKPELQYCRSRKLMVPSQQYVRANI